MGPAAFRRAVFAFFGGVHRGTLWGMGKSRRRRLSRANAFAQLMDRVAQIKPDRMGVLLSGVEKGGAFDKAKSIVRDLISALHEFSSLRTGLWLIDLLPSEEITQLDAVRVAYSSVRQYRLRRLVIDRALIGNRLFAKYTDATRLYVQIRRFLDWTPMVRSAEELMILVSRRVLALSRKLEAIESIVDLRYSRFAAKMEDGIERTTASWSSVRRRGGYLQLGMEWIDAISRTVTGYMEAANARGISPGEAPPRPEERDATIASLLLGAMSATPMTARPLCAKVGVKYNAHSRTALSWLVKQRSCQLRKGRGGGYYRP